MDPKIAQTLMQFMQRVQLTGAEVQTFIMCMNELQKLAHPEEAKPPSPLKAVSD